MANIRRALSLWCFIAFSLAMLGCFSSQALAIGEIVNSVNSGGGWKNPIFGKDDPCTNTRRKCDLLNTTAPQKFMDDLAEKSQVKADSMCTVGACMAGVARAVTGLCFPPQESAICGNATGSGKCFLALGFKKCDFTKQNRKAMQNLKIKGAIYVYSGGPKGNGHVEVYTGDKAKPWCSDHCSTFAMQSPIRIPEAIFVPPSFDPLQYASQHPDQPGAAALKCDSLDSRQVAAQ